MIVWSRAGRLAPFAVLEHSDTTGTDATHEALGSEDACPGCLESLLAAHGSAGYEGEDSCRGDAVRQHSICPQPSIRLASACAGPQRRKPAVMQQPIAVAERAEGRLIVWRLKKANVVSRFAHDRLVRTETNRNVVISSKWYAVVKQLN